MFIFSESKTINKASKLQLINFIEGASEHQLKLLALDGEVTPQSKLDEQTCSILDDRFAAATTVVRSLKKASLEAFKKTLKK